MTDQEFAAFEAGLPPHALFNTAHTLRLPPPPPPPLIPGALLTAPLLPPISSPGLSSWAVDFQKLHLAPSSDRTGPPVQQQQQRLLPSADQRWLDTRAQGGSSVGRERPLYDAYAPGHAGPYWSDWQGGARSDAPLATRSPSLLTAHADPAAFEQAFVDAIARETAVRQAPTLPQQQQQVPSSHDIHDALPRHERRAAALDGPVQDERQDADTAADADADALAQTAGRLLASVADNGSDKFRDSAFLSLMRKLRDKVATVEGDAFVTVGHDESGARPPSDHSMRSRADNTEQLHA